jgi:hypothetical protein
MDTSSLNNLISIDYQTLIPLLTCSICNGIFRTPLTVKECMHSFCKACVYKLFYNKPNLDKCPKCNLNLGGKPIETFIFDSYLKNLIDILFPQFEVIDKENTEKMYETFRSNGIPLPGDGTFNKKNKPTLSISLLPLKTSEKDNEILPKIEKNKISVPPSMRISALKVYISNKLQSQMKDLTEKEVSAEDLNVFYNGVCISDDFSFDNIEKIYKFPEGKIIFSYAFK